MMYKRLQECYCKGDEHQSVISKNNDILVEDWSNFLQKLISFHLRLYYLIQPGKNL